MGYDFGRINMQKKSLSFEERVLDLVAKMTLEEKISQLCVAPPAISRLGIPKYNFINEASHGIFLLNCVNGNEYEVTSFPVCLNMSQSWDCEKVEKVASVISDEARAYANICGETLNFFTPTINLGRDPRNGRSDENFGEDPVLAGKMAAGYIRGFQGNDEKYLKAVSTPKHFMLNSSENNRHFGSSNVDEATLREYYGKVFEYAIKEGRAESVMTSYNRINGVPASANEFLLKTLLREEWGFDGFVISDAGAVDDVYKNPMFAPEKKHKAHYYCLSGTEAVAASMTAGLDVSLGAEYCKNLKNALDEKLISEDDIDKAVYRSLLSRFKLGLFDDTEKVPFSTIGMEHVCSRENQELSVDMARDSIVLLKNESNLLPLKKRSIKKLLIVGPNAKYRQLGGYACGSTNRLIDTPVNIMALDGIKQLLTDTDIEICYEKGWCTNAEKQEMDIALPGVDLTGGWFDYMGFDITEDDIIKMENATDRHYVEDSDRGMDEALLFERALNAAKDADVVVMLAGTDGSCASEEHDREELSLPYGQNEKIKRMLKANPNTVIVLTTPGMVTGDFMDEAHTLLYAGFAGEAQGTAIAEILFGNTNPNAKLTATWYKSEKDLPHVNDYGLKKQDTIDGKARTYMYFDGEVRFPFGYGLSYTQYEYSNMKIEKSELSPNETLKISVDVTNTGLLDGREIVELYIRRKDETLYGNGKPIRQLKQFVKVEVKAGETKRVHMSLPLKEVSFWNNFRKKLVVEEGGYVAEFGKSSTDIVCTQEFRISGKWNPVLGNVSVGISKLIYKPGEKGRLEIAVTLEDTMHLPKEDYLEVFSSSDPAVVKVDEKGIIEAVFDGTAEIVAEVLWNGNKMCKKIYVMVKSK